MEKGSDQKKNVKVTFCENGKWDMAVKIQQIFSSTTPWTRLEGKKDEKNSTFESESMPIFLIHSRWSSSQLCASFLFAWISNQICVADGIFSFAFFFGNCNWNFLYLLFDGDDGEKRGWKMRKFRLICCRWKGNIFCVFRNEKN